MTIEAYRMASPAEAFGIFSLKREGGERVSPEIEAVHWLSPSQAGLAAGNFYISITGLNAAGEELEAFTAAASRKIGAASALPDELSLLPSSGRKKGSERYIQGRLAAEGESLLLDRPFWGFERGTVAVSAKYGDSASKLVIVAFSAPVPGLGEEVQALFSEYLEDVAVRDGLLGGKNAAGRWFLFASEGMRAYLVLAEPDYEAAARLLRGAAQWLERVISRILSPALRRAAVICLPSGLLRRSSDSLCPGGEVRQISNAFWLVCRFLAHPPPW